MAGRDDEDLVHAKRELGDPRPDSTVAPSVPRECTQERLASITAQLSECRSMLLSSDPLRVLWSPLTSQVNCLFWCLHSTSLASANGRMPPRARVLGLIGLLVVGARMANGGLWEKRSLRLQAINIGHETVLFAVQGAILAVWR